MNPTYKSINQFFLIILGSFIAIVISIAGYKLLTKEFVLDNGQNQVVTPTPTQSSINGVKDWKTYINNLYGFSLKYPSNLTYSSSGDDFGNVGYVTFERRGNEYVTINLSDSFDLESVGNFMRSKPKSIYNIGNENWNYYSFHYKDELVENLQYNVTAYEILRKDLLYVIVFRDQLELTSEQRQILSTFRFLDETNLSPTPISQISPKNGCIISGCNREICAEEEMSSICVYNEKFACYKTAVCETQMDGNCGWTMTADLKECLGS